MLEHNGAPGATASAARTWGDRWIAVRPSPAARRGQGTVWKVRDARDTTTGGPPPLYALKEMQRPRRATSLAYQRFVREIETTRRLAMVHHGIVPVVDAFLPEEGAPGIPYYVMPWADLTLERAQYLAGPDALERVLRIGMRLAEALRACHEADPPVVHRDVKPANVLLMGPAHEPQLADFGICYLQDEERTRVTSTEAGTVGSEGYTAPELLGGGKIDAVGPAADVYSLGKTLYAVASGGDPFPREAHRLPKFDLAARFDDRRFEHLHGLLDHMAVEDPAGRYATMAECGEQLARAVANLQRGVACVPGMYGAGESPRERHAALRRILDGPQGLQRSDAMHDALERAFASVDARALAFEQEHPGMQTVVGQPHVEGMAAAAECAEHLLSAALPLVQSDERDAFEDWLGRTTVLGRRDDYRYAPHRQVAAAGAVLAAYGAAAGAWLLRRDGILGRLVEAYVRADSDWIHLDLLERSAGRLLPWVHTALSASTVVRADLANRSPEQLADAASVFPGLFALRDLQTSPPDVQRLLDAGQFEQIQMPAYPMCYVDGARWASTLAGACLQSGARERGIAEHVFKLKPDALRDMCRRVTPVLAWWTARMNREIGRRVNWRFTVDGEQVWKSWCGGEPKALG